LAQALRRLRGRSVISNFDRVAHRFVAAETFFAKNAPLPLYELAVAMDGKNRKNYVD
jgi:hypothetical protein